jgi:hypothetical protein
MSERSTSAATAGPDAPPMPVYVLATTTAGTRCALNSARHLTRGLTARVVLLVPRLRSSSLVLDSKAKRSAIVDEHHAVAASLGMNLTVHLCVCHRLDDVAHQLTGRSSLLIVGGHRNPLWWSREERLVSRLIGQGYPVLFARVGAEPATAWSGSAPLEAFLRNSLGRPEARAPIVVQDDRVMSTPVARMEPLGRPALNDSTRPWWLAGIAFVVLLACLTLWAWITRPATDRFGAPVAASHRSY